MKTEQVGGRVLHTHDLSAAPELDASSPRWNLKEGQASMVLGLDVLTPQRQRPERGRTPAGVSLPLDEGPFTSVIDLDVSGRAPFIYNGVLDSVLYNSTNFAKPANSTTTYLPATGQLTNAAMGSMFAFRVGRDRVLVRPEQVDTQNTMSAAHLVLGSVGPTNVLINAGFTYTSPFHMAFFRGRTWFAASDLAPLVDSLGNLNGLYTYFVKSADLYDEEGPWTDDFVDNELVLNEDYRAAPLVRIPIKGLANYCRPNDALLLPNSTGTVKTDTLFTIGTKFSVLLQKSFSHPGFLVTNGRKFWRMDGSSYTLVLDLGSDSFRGTRWRGTKIARNRMLLTAPSKAPRVFSFSRTTVSAGEEVLAGMPAPRKPNRETIEEGNIADVSWLQFNDASKGSLPLSNADRGVQTKVRLVNLEGDDGLASALVDVVDSTTDTVPTSAAAATLKTLTALNDGISVFTTINMDEESVVVGNNQEGWTPPIHPRATHLEIWRTKANDATVYQREAQLPLIQPGQEDVGTNHASWFDPTLLLNGRFPIRLADVDLTSLPVLTISESQAHGLPPICQDSVSLGGTTLCFGKADEVVEKPPIYGINFYRNTPGAVYTRATGVLDLSGTSECDAYTFVPGDQYVVPTDYDTIRDTDSLPAGIYDIITRPATGQITIVSGLGSAATANVFGYIRRPYPINYPVIESDEQAWYSRTDGFAPEGFPPRVLRFSGRNDTFRRAVVLGSYCVVVMDSGVHLLFKEGVDLLTNTVEASGVGTPWPDSVIVVGDKVLWATSLGINALTVRPQPDITGRRGFVDRITALRFQSWFTEAAENKETIDAGFDAYRKAIRFRRHKADGTYQVLQHSLETGLWTFLDGDNGFRYVQATDGFMYSVEQRTGAAWRVNSLVRTNLAKDETLDPTVHTFTHQSIHYIANTGFSPLSVGDVLTFSHGHTRVVLTATNDTITFDSVPDLTYGLRFTLGAIKFRQRYSHMVGESPERIQTLHQAITIFRPGENGDKPGVTVRCFEGLADTPSSEAVVQSFLDGEPGRTSQDRVCSVEGASTDLEIEVETLGDFDVETLLIRTSEESSMVERP